MKSYSNISLVENHTIIKKILVSCLLSFVLCSKTIAMSFPDNQKNKKAPCQTFLWVQLGTTWRKVRDSNPRMLAHQRFSRPPLSTAQPTFRIEIAEKSAIFYSVLRFYKFRPLDLQFVEKFVEFTTLANGL